MDIKDYALSFPDQATWETLADAQGWKQVDGNGNTYFFNPAITFVVIGKVYPPLPNPLPEPYDPVPYPGYGVNLRFIDSSLPQTMNQYIIQPDPQMYGFAGGWIQG